MQSANIAGCGEQGVDVGGRVGLRWPWDTAHRWKCVPASASHPGRNHPSRGGTNSDALVGHGPCHVLSMRPASRMEANPALQGTPHFSRCVVPLVLLLDW